MPRVLMLLQRCAHDVYASVAARSDVALSVHAPKFDGVGCSTRRRALSHIWPHAVSCSRERRRARSDAASRLSIRHA